MITVNKINYHPAPYEVVTKLLIIFPTWTLHLCDLFVSQLEVCITSFHFAQQRLFSVIKITIFAL